MGLDRETKLRLIKSLQKMYADDIIAKYMSYINNELDLSKFKNEGKISVVGVINFLQELRECNCCGELNEQDNLTNTRGMINGDYGVVCPQCLKDGR